MIPEGPRGHIYIYTQLHRPQKIREEDVAQRTFWPYKSGFDPRDLMKSKLTVGPIYQESFH